MENKTTDNEGDRVKYQEKQSPYESKRNGI